MIATITTADAMRDQQPPQLAHTAGQIASRAITGASWDSRTQTIELGEDLTITWSAQTRPGSLQVNGVAAESLAADQKQALAGVLETARLARGSTLALFVARPFPGIPANYHLHIERYLADGQWSDLADYPSKRR